ncbi:hypothetical protein LO772_21110 [Yinghuangia sp. ASG 101]|uniref:glycoside hydrolase family 113 n=1 Tax=Yinghuangia sp. ASG 101 TaxID=2896848 RepID=UPI001E439304|nr:hypothetical protein [Yinghuangia sp. ASG 101]UGQ09435.1 hypothetical protein LO772_21110 [Yinghuangia sp. ASG 101]
MSRSQLPKLAVLPVTVVAAVVALPVAFGVNPLRWSEGSAVPRVVTDDRKPAAEAAAARPEFADPVLDPAEPVAPPPPPPPAGEPEPQVPRVAQPWQPGMPQWGVQLYWEDMQTDDESAIRGKARRLADYLVSLNANSVALSFPVYTSGIDADEVFAGPKTPSVERVTPVVETLHAAGLRVSLRPILDERELLPEWRGAIKPKDKDAWFASYRDLLLPYAEMAEREDVATIVVGVELASMEDEVARWNGFLAALREVFGGELTYDTNYPNFLENSSRVPVDSTGVDAYFPVKNQPDDASVDTIAAAWNTWLDQRSTGPMSDVVISETGIGAQNGAFAAPGDFYRYGTVNARVQATWYTAVCQVVKQRQMAGVYWWSVNFHDDPTTPPTSANSRLDFAARPATEQAVRGCFGGAPAASPEDPATSPTGSPTGKSTTKPPSGTTKSPTTKPSSKTTKPSGGQTTRRPTATTSSSD